MYHENPNYSDDKPVKALYLWLSVILTICAGLLLWAYLETIPYHTHLEPSGPSSSLYGPLK